MTDQPSNSDRFNNYLEPRAPAPRGLTAAMCARTLTNRRASQWSGMTHVTRVVRNTLNNRPGRVIEPRRPDVMYVTNEQTIATLKKYGYYGKEAGVLMASRPRIVNFNNNLQQVD